MLRRLLLSTGPFPHVFFLQVYRDEYLYSYYRDTAAMREVKDRLIDAATLSPEELLAKRARDLAEELRKLEEAVKAGNLPGNQLFSLYYSTFTERLVHNNRGSGSAKSSQSSHCRPVGYSPSTCRRVY